MSTRFPPHALHDYALPADGERGAVIGPDGAIGWLCAPTWQDEAVFSDLVGGGACTPSLPPAGTFFGGYYEEGTLIWRSRWVTDEGIVECREALAFPGDPDRLVLLRQLRAVDGPARLSVVLDPHSGYGTTAVESARRSGDGVWELRTGSHRLRWQGAPQAVAGERGLTADLELEPGERHELVLECAVSPPPADLPKPEQAWAATEAAWHETVPALDDTVAPRDARRAYAVLR
ncbi:trehalase-like domain-containing protein, partial [Streptomyces sp. 12257]